MRYVSKGATFAFPLKPKRVPSLKETPTYLGDSILIFGWQMIGLSLLFLIFARRFSSDICVCLVLRVPFLRLFSREMNWTPPICLGVLFSQRPRF